MNGTIRAVGVEDAAKWSTSIDFNDLVCQQFQRLLVCDSASDLSQCVCKGLFAGFFQRYYEVDYQKRSL